ncbi:MAG: GTPase, partial [Gammaproteobacteria bacterium]
MTHPVFAIVGHPNKGKSSVVATLAEDDTVAIAPDPGTTRRARGFQMRCDGEVLYELVDTPGFQRPRAALAWLQEHEQSASRRAEVVAAFVAAHAGGARFHDECELLRPILAGAGILYVVDGALPYGREYEAEMEILRWTGQPRMALINPMGRHDHVDEWRRALNQYFSIVRVFDAVHADFGKRIELLRAFRQLGEGLPGWADALSAAVT